ncbi:uncharacterized protein LOC109539134 [Dendroctonus ponderosae]|uniref:uncharacterized protein LOC109539134 n=1 Tax=Dendroctonus ponderosae TaxID=77166 RepID=UPI00203575E2|nr:uncharacterized protein LOC109539134 [Dendroctonus ponderosae]KAH1008299.1 hypothetical protein HUJ05_008866 [Dendroctonus ponderosae]
MKLPYLLICLWVFLPLSRSRPDAPYYYSAPAEVENPFTRTSGFPSAALSQSYLPANRAPEHSQPSFNNVPATSYGTPLLRTSILPSSSSLTPQRNYGSPEVRSQLPPLSPYSAQPQRAVNIQKHFYFHVAPPEMEEQRPQRIHEPKVAQKHYKIIFVKVPSYAPAAKYVEQQQALQEEKTLIYVLVKKPEEEVPVRANQVAAPINKPEVYFVKYKGKADAPPVPTGEQSESVQNEDNDSVVVESAGRTSQPQAQGYIYEKHVGVLK